MLSIILYAIIAVGTTIPLYQKFKDLPEVEVTLVEFLLPLPIIMLALVGLTQGFIRLFQAIHVDSDGHAVIAASMILAFFFVDCCIIERNKRMIYFFCITAVTSIMVGLSTIYKVYLAIPVLPQPASLDFLRTPFISLFPLFLNWGFSKRMDSWRHSLYKSLIPILILIQYYLKSIQEK